MASKNSTDDETTPEQISENTESKSLVEKIRKDDGVLIVVGIGASAGGLEALQAMVSNLPNNSGMSFILAQHLSPSYRSVMVELLERESTIAVVQAKNNESLRANTLYVCPPNFNIEINPNDTISLTRMGENRHIPRPSVDLLFESLAIVKGEGAIGIVLSGTGTDGSRGIRAIKGEGGFSIAQDPNTAKYDGMPNVAINSGNIDMILSPEEIGPELKNISSYPRQKPLGFESNFSREVYDEILLLLKRRFKVDFTLYKEATIMRRMLRRLTALRIDEIEGYLKYLTEHDEEAEFLFNDMLLIGVTAFFRDAIAFKQLEDELKVYLNHKEDKIMRVWTPGVSTGEEAYTIAMILSEIIGQKIKEWKIQIFATDIDKRAIAAAREGIYPESALHNLPENRKHKYFTVNGEHFQIIKPIKAMVIFSIHDVTLDPPFLRLDLLSCRNLLIYFKLELQRQLLPIFHYALNSKGLLFLGKSETIGVFQENFRALSKSAKLYQANFLGKKLPPERHTIGRQMHSYTDYLEPHDHKQHTSSAKKTSESLQEIISGKITEEILPYVIVINDNMDIVYTIGQNPLLVRPEGLPTNNIFQNLHPSMSVDLRAGLHLINSGKPLEKTAFQKVELNHMAYWARLILMNVEYQSGIGRLVMIYCQLEDVLDLPLEPIEGDETNVINEQERQLLKAKEQLQTVIEELESSNEEMQSMNEELQSSNEELQSSNEELETTNEELQSTNEELQTAYSELRLSYEDKARQQLELEQTKKELLSAKALLEEAEKIGSTGSFRWHIPDNEMEWSYGAFELFGQDKRVFNPTYEALIELVNKEDRQEFAAYIENLLKGSSSVSSFNFKSKNSTGEVIWLQMEAAVSFNELKQAQVMMGTVKNVTDLIRAKKLIEERNLQVNTLLNNKLSGIYIYGFEEKTNIFINEAYTEILGYYQAELNNMSEEQFINLFHPDDIDRIMEHMDLVYKSKLGETFTIFYRFKHKQGHYIQVYSKDTIYQVDDENDRPKSMLGVFMEVLDDEQHHLTVPRI